MVMDKSGEKPYVADETANRITIINSRYQKVDNHIALSGTRGGLTLSADGSKMYVTLAIPEGKLIKIDLETRKVSRSLNVDQTPMSPVLSYSGKTLYLCNCFD